MSSDRWIIKHSKLFIFSFLFSSFFFFFFYYFLLWIYEHTFRKARSYINSDRRFPVTNCEQATTACILGCRAFDSSSRAIRSVRNCSERKNIFFFFPPFRYFVFNYVQNPNTKNTRIHESRFNLHKLSTGRDTTNFRAVVQHGYNGSRERA